MRIDRHCSKAAMEKVLGEGHPDKSGVEEGLAVGRDARRQVCGDTGMHLKADNDRGPLLQACCRGPGAIPMPRPQSGPGRHLVCRWCWRCGRWQPTCLQTGGKGAVAYPCPYCRPSKGRHTWGHGGLPVSISTIVQARDLGPPATSAGGVASQGATAHGAGGWVS